MTKAEIVKAIAANTGIEKSQVLAVVEGVMEEIKKSLANGENVYLRGFGTFEIKHRAEKKARNITAKTTVTIPARDVPHFKPSPDMTVSE